MSPEEQFEKDYEQGRRRGLLDAESLLYDLAEKVPTEQRGVVFDAILNPLREEIRRRLSEDAVR